MFFYLESFLLIFGILGFSFFARENIREFGNHGFQKLSFRGIKYIYLILSTFLSIFFVRDKTLKVLLKVIKEHLPLKLIETYYRTFLSLKPKWYVDNK